MLTERTERRTIDPADVASRIELLENDARVAFLFAVEHLLTTMENGGTAVCAIDAHGDGTLTVAALGSQELVNPILGAMARMYHMFTTHDGEMLQ